MEKKRLLTSLNKLPLDVLALIKSKYPSGYSRQLQEVKDRNNNSMYVLPVETNEATYLVKIDSIRQTNISQLDKLLSEDDDNIPASSNELPIENIVIDKEEI